MPNGALFATRKCQVRPSKKKFVPAVFAPNLVRLDADAPPRGRPIVRNRRAPMSQTKSNTKPSRRAVVTTGLGAGVLLAAQGGPSHGQNGSSKMEATIRLGGDI